MLNNRIEELFNSEKFEELNAMVEKINTTDLARALSKIEKDLLVKNLFVGVETPTCI